MYEEEKKQKVLDLFKQNSEPVPRESGGGHTVSGHNSILVCDTTGPVEIHNGPSLDPGNPDLIHCPVCRRLVSYTADECPDCHDNFQKRRRQAWEEGKRRRGYIMLAVFAVVAAGGWGISKLMPEHAVIAGMVSLISLVGMIKVASLLE